MCVCVCVCVTCWCYDDIAPFFIANIHVYVLMYPGHGPGISAGVCSIRKVARVCLAFGRWILLCVCVLWWCRKTKYQSLFNLDLFLTFFSVITSKGYNILSYTLLGVKKYYKWIFGLFAMIVIEFLYSVFYLGMTWIRFISTSKQWRINTVASFVAYQPIRAGKSGWGGPDRIAGAERWLPVSTYYLTSIVLD